MSATTFNPLGAARDLEAAGVERKQAEAHAEALRQAATADRGEFATNASRARPPGAPARLSTRHGSGTRWAGSSPGTSLPPSPIGGWPSTSGGRSTTGAWSMNGTTRGSTPRRVPRRHLRASHQRARRAALPRRHGAHLQGAGRRRTLVPHAEGARRPGAPHPPPRGAPGQGASARMPAGRLPGVAPAPRLGAAAVRRRDPGRRPAHPRPRRPGHHSASGPSRARDRRAAVPSAYELARSLGVYSGTLERWFPERYAQLVALPASRCQQASRALLDRRCGALRAAVFDLVHSGWHPSLPALSHAGLPPTLCRVPSVGPLSRQPWLPVSFRRFRRGSDACPFVETRKMLCGENSQDSLECRFKSFNSLKYKHNSRSVSMDVCLGRRDLTFPSFFWYKPPPSPDFSPIERSAEVSGSNSVIHHSDGTKNAFPSFRLTTQGHIPAMNKPSRHNIRLTNSPITPQL